jgi:hypothetical protein
MKTHQQAIVLACVISSLSASVAMADIPSILKPGTDIHVDRYTAVARGRHGQWVRASAVLKSNGDLIAQLGLETDSTFFGIAGTVTVLLKDKDGKVVGSAETAQCSLAGKPPGKAVRKDFTSKIQTVPKSVADQVVTIEAIPNVKEDNLPRPVGIGDWKIQIDFLHISL